MSGTRGSVVAASLAGGVREVEGARTSVGWGELAEVMWGRGVLGPAVRMERSSRRGINGV